MIAYFNDYSNIFKGLQTRKDQRLAGIKTYIYSLTKEDAEMLVTKQLKPTDPQLT
jgi:hypothetical protein